MSFENDNQHDPVLIENVFVIGFIIILIAKRVFQRESKKERETDIQREREKESKPLEVRLSYQLI